MRTSRQGCPLHLASLSTNSTQPPRSCVLVIYIYFCSFIYLKAMLIIFIFHCIQSVPQLEGTWITLLHPDGIMSHIYCLFISIATPKSRCSWSRMMVVVVMWWLIFTPAVTVFIWFSKALQINITTSIFACLYQSSNFVSENSEVWPLVGISIPTPGDDPEQLCTAVVRSFQSVPISYTSHYLTSTHGGVWHRPWKSAINFISHSLDNTKRVW